MPGEPITVLGPLISIFFQKQGVLRFPPCHRVLVHRVVIVLIPAKTNELSVEKLDRLIRVLNLANCQVANRGASAKSLNIVVFRPEGIGKEERLIFGCRLFAGRHQVGDPVDAKMAPLGLLRQDERVQLQESLGRQIELARPGGLCPALAARTGLSRRGRQSRPSTTRSFSAWQDAWL